MKVAIQLLKTVPDSEDDKTIAMLNDMAQVKQRGYLLKQEFLKIMHWKSPRPINHYKQNSPEEIKLITQLAFAADHDALKIHILTALKGVKYPSASAILMFYDPAKYAVLDIRVWKQLHRLKIVSENAKGQAFTFHQAEKFLQLIREIAQKMNLTPRQVEKRLFDYDRTVQTAPIYGKQIYKKKKSNNI